MWSFLVIAALFIETTSAILQCGLTIMAYKGKGTKGSHSSQISSVDSRFFPWMVMISGKFNKQQVPLCVGALIESGEITKTYYVLTSASCIHNVDVRKIRVHYKALNKSTEVMYKKARAQRVLLPEIKRPGTKYFGKNIGLLRVEEPIPLSEYSHPVCLPLENDALAISPDSSCFVTFMDFNVLSGENTNIYEYKPSLLDDAGCENRHLAQLPTNAMCLSDVVPYENLVAVAQYCYLAMLHRLPNHNFKVFGPQQKAAQDDSRTRPLAAAPVLSDGRKSGLFLWIHLNDDAESKSVIQTVTELHLLADEICPPITCKSANRLIHGVGFGEAFLRKVVRTALQGCVKNDRFLKVAPKDMVKTFPHVARGSGKTGMPNSGGDIFVHAKSDSRSNLFEFAWLITNEIAPFTKVFDDIYGFTFKDGRDLSGFIDGTENPPENERQEVCIEENTGGSYCITQKWVHDLPFIASQPQNIMESFIGRTMHTDMELNDKAETSHLSRTRAGSEYKGPKPFRIYRQSMPYGKVAGEAGLLFIAFANSTKNFDYQLDRMFGHSPDGLNDDITHFTTCVRSNYWYFPSVEELRRISDNVK